MKKHEKYFIIVKMQYDKIGLYIRKKREAMDMSLNAFAIANDIDPAILSRIERLKQDTKLNVLKKIAQGFDKTAGEFLIEYEKESKD